MGAGAAIVLSVCAATAGVAASTDMSGSTGLVVLPADGVELAGESEQTGTLTIANGLPEPVNLTLTATMRGADGKAVPAKVAAPNGTLRPGASVEAVVTAAGLGNGLFVAVARDLRGQVVAVEARPLSPAKATLPAPAVGAWALYHDASDDRGSAIVPVIADCPQSWPAKKFVLAGDGKSVDVTANCSGSGLALTYTAANPGSYEGKLKISDSSELDVTLTRARPWFEAMLCVIIGALIGWAAAAWLERRPLHALKARMRAYDDALEQAKNRAQAEAKRDPVKQAIGNITRARVRVDGLSAKIDGVLPKHFVVGMVQGIPASRVSEVASDVQELFADLNRVRAAAAALEGLREALEAAGSPMAANSKDAVGARVKREAEVYFDQAWDWDNGEARVEDIKALGQILSLLPGLASARGLADAYENGPTLEEPDRSALFDARLKLEEIGLVIDGAESATSIVGRKLDDDLRSVVATLRTIRFPAASSRVDESTTSVDMRVTRIADWGPLRDALRSLASTRLPAIIVKAMNWAAFLVALAIALFAGYTAFYAGKPWGSTADVVSAVIYGATAVVAAVSLAKYFGDPIQAVQS